MGKLKTAKAADRPELFKHAAKFLNEMFELVDTGRVADDCLPILVELQTQLLAHAETYEKDATEITADFDVV